MGWAPVVRAGAPLAAQHVLAAVVGCVTPAILVANAANNAGGNVDMGLFDPGIPCVRCTVYIVTVICAED